MTMLSIVLSFHTIKFLQSDEDKFLMVATVHIFDDVPLQYDPAFLEETIKSSYEYPETHIRKNHPTNDIRHKFLTR